MLCISGADNMGSSKAELWRGGHAEEKTELNGGVYRGICRGYIGEYTGVFSGV